MKKELKPEDVMRGLECCDGSFVRCGECPYDANECWKLEKDAIDLLKKYQAENAEKDAEIERLKAEVGKEFICFVGDPHRVDHCTRIDEIERLTKDFLDYQADVNMEIADARAEAIDEFAERLKSTPKWFRQEYIEYFDKPSIVKLVPFIDKSDIDRIAKEMKGGASDA